MLDTILVEKNFTTSAGPGMHLLHCTRLVLCVFLCRNEMLKNTSKHNFGPIGRDFDEKSFCNFYGLGSAFIALHQTRSMRVFVPKRNVQKHIQTKFWDFWSMLYAILAKKVFATSVGSEVNLLHCTWPILREFSCRNEMAKNTSKQHFGRKNKSLIFCVDIMYFTLIRACTWTFFFPSYLLQHDKKKEEKREEIRVRPNSFRPTSGISSARVLPLCWGIDVPDGVSGGACLPAGENRDL